MRALAFALAALGAASARADALDAWAAANETTCVGKPDAALAAPVSYEKGGAKFDVRGATAEIVLKAKDLKLGVVNAIKDFEPATKANLDDFLARFKEAGVSALVVGGDTAFDKVEELTAIFNYLGATDLPVLVVIGNSESRGAFNAALRAVHAAHPNVLNLDLVRKVKLSGLTLVSLPGYYDRKFLNDPGAGCVYKGDDVRGIPDLVAGTAGPVVIVSHGPPHMDGKGALDYAGDAGNVGDPEMTQAIAAAKINFGIFGHVLEAGGRGTDLTGKKDVKPKTPAAQLFVNPGPANSLPWKMNQGPDSHGMAMIVTFTPDAKASYEVLRAAGGPKKM